MACLVSGSHYSAIVMLKLFISNSDSRSPCSNQNRQRACWLVLPEPYAPGPPVSTPRAQPQSRGTGLFSDSSWLSPVYSHQFF